MFLEALVTIWPARILTEKRLDRRGVLAVYVDGIVFQKGSYIKEIDTWVIFR